MNSWMCWVGELSGIGVGWEWVEELVDGLGGRVD